MDNNELICYRQRELSFKKTGSQKRGLLFMDNLFINIVIIETALMVLGYWFYFFDMQNKVIKIGVKFRGLLFSIHSKQRIISEFINGGLGFFPFRLQKHFGDLHETKDYF